MSSGVFYSLAAAGILLAAAALVIGARALRHSRTTEVFERQPQKYMLQTEPPSTKVHALSLPLRETAVDAPREKQA